MNCPDCQKPMTLQEYYDTKAWQCSDCIFHRVLEDGTLQHCFMNMDTGALTWKAPKPPRKRPENSSVTKPERKPF